MALYVLHSVGQGNNNSQNQIKRWSVLMFFMRSILNNHADTIKHKSNNQIKEGGDSEAESHFSSHTEKVLKNFSVCEYVAIHPLMNGHA